MVFEETVTEKRQGVVSIREAVNQAYEEAAKVAEKSSDHNYEAHVGRVSQSIADEIRALKRK